MSRQFLPGSNERIHRARSGQSRLRGGRTLGRLGAQYCFQAGRDDRSVGDRSGGGFHKQDLAARYRRLAVSILDRQPAGFDLISGVEHVLAGYALRVQLCPVLASQIAQHQLRTDTLDDQVLPRKTAVVGIRKIVSGRASERDALARDRDDVSSACGFENDKFFFSCPGSCYGCCVFHGYIESTEKKSPAHDVSGAGLREELKLSEA